MSLRTTDFIELKFSDIPSSSRYHKRNGTNQRGETTFMCCQ